MEKTKNKIIKENGDKKNEQHIKTERNHTENQKYISNSDQVYRQDKCPLLFLEAPTEFLMSCPVLYGRRKKLWRME